MKKSFSVYLFASLLALLPLCAMAEGSAANSSTANLPKTNLPMHLTLEDAITYSLQNSRSLKSASLDLETKKDAAAHKLNFLLPDVKAGATLNRTTKVSSSVPGYDVKERDHWSLMGTVSASMNLNLSVIQQMKQTQAEYEAGRISWEQTVKQNKRDITKIFYSLLLQQITLDNDRQALANAKERSKQAERNYLNGLSPKVEVLQSQVSCKNMEMALQKSELALNEQFQQFAYLLGIPVGTQIVLDGSMTDRITQINEAQIRKLISGTSSEVSLLQKNLEAYNAQIKANNLGSFTPTLSLNYGFKPMNSGFYDMGKSDSWRDTGSVSATLTWDITNMLPFSENRLANKKLKRQKEKTQLAIADQQEKNNMDVSKILDEMWNAKTSMDANKENIALARESYQLTYESYSNGGTDYQALRDAQDELNKALLAEQSNYYTFQAGLADLEYMFGSL